VRTFERQALAHELQELLLRVRLAVVEAEVPVLLVSGVTVHLTTQNPRWKSVEALSFEEAERGTGSRGETGRRLALHCTPQHCTARHLSAADLGGTEEVVADLMRRVVVRRWRRRQRLAQRHAVLVLDVLSRPLVRVDDLHRSSAESDAAADDKVSRPQRLAVRRQNDLRGIEIDTREREKKKKKRSG
jgi:hypothetical protein